MKKVRAVLATIPGRERACEVAMRSLREQVDELCVICHDYQEAPAAVRELADRFTCEADVAGSAAKLKFSASWDGLYLACDDDWRYPDDYARVMGEWVDRFEGKALVTCHGRILTAKAKGFRDVAFAVAPRDVSPGGWLNYPGACALAWDAGVLELPTTVPGKNLEEVHLAVWAQLHGVPIWLIPRPASFLKYQLALDDERTIWAQESGVGFKNRNEVISGFSKHHAWRVTKMPLEGW